jgi:hypothetical protein
VLEFPGLAGPLVSTGWQLVLAKLDGAGHWLWASDGGLLGGAGYSIMADGGGGVYLGGASASASIGGLSYRPYVARWSGAGTRLWAQTGSGSGQVTGLALDADDSVFAAGHFANNLSFGGVFLAGSFSDVFVARLAGADGAMGWALASGNTSSTFLTCNGATRCGAGRLCVVGAAASDSSAGSTYQFGAFTQFTGSSELFVAAAGETADVPPAGTWTALGTTEDAP